MTTIDRSHLIHSFLKQRQAFQTSSHDKTQGGQEQSQPRPAAPTAGEAPRYNLPVPVAADTQSIRAGETVLQGLAAAQPKLISESVDTLERGFRRTQVYRQSDGRDFIRNEEITLTASGMKRVVDQQNPSGSRVNFEDNLDRQADGTFRRTVRYTDETGSTQTKIERAPDGVDPFIMSNGSYGSDAKTPYDAQRGQYLDLDA